MMSMRAISYLNWHRKNTTGHCPSRLELQLAAYGHGSVEQQPIGILVPVKR